MSAQSLFSKKKIKEQIPDTHRGILEELNLPPALISFIRKNSKNLQIVLICAVVLVLGWISFDYYSGVQEKKGASLLASSLENEATEQRTQALEKVIAEYGRTSAARWAKIELAHLDYKDGRFDAAAAKYSEVLEKLPADNPLVPLTRLNLAQSYEEENLFDQAIKQYDQLKKTAGFTNQAYLGLARMYMAKKDPVKARGAYQELLGNLEETPDPAIKSQVEAQLALLDEDSPVIPSPPEGNKE
jgi:predicted negative regulator of RcsB-dependent stress response